MFKIWKKKNPNEFSYLKRKGLRRKWNATGSKFYLLFQFFNKNWNWSSIFMKNEMPALYYFILLNWLKKKRRFNANVRDQLLNWMGSIQILARIAFPFQFNLGFNSTHECSRALWSKYKTLSKIPLFTAALPLPRSHYLGMYHFIVKVAFPRPKTIFLFSPEIDIDIGIGSWLIWNEMKVRRDSCRAVTTLLSFISE